MNNSIIFFDSKSKLINPSDEIFNGENLVEFFVEIDNSIDQVLTRIIYDKLMNNEFTNIIIPVCFGETLSDFLGLRLATHIRCTPGVNREKNIFLYSFTGIEDYFSNECFNILKTKGVFLIDYNVDSILQSSKNEKSYLSTERIPNEVFKLKLDIPLNYEDSHSLANEWAIYRWANTINASNKEIINIESKLENDLYFKYLKTIYPINTSDIITEDELQLKYEGEPTILYIDDEANKGWSEIFEKIMFEANDIDFLHLDDEFNEKSKKEIIDISMDKIKDKDENVDVVILDFRLHKSDFDQTSIEDITGYKLLKEIKEYNKGIQVIIFSATSKIWNLQALQEAGADGFIMKESPENHVNSNFTKQTIENIILKLNECLSMVFLKDVCINIENIKTHILSISNTTGNLGLNEGLVRMKFKNEIFIQLDIIYDCLKRSSQNISTFINDENSYLNLSFISIFKILELINDFYTNERGTLLKSGTPVQHYNKNDNSFSTFKGDYPTTRDKIFTIIDVELDSSPKDYFQKIHSNIIFRNNIIHPKTLKNYKKTSKKENLRFLILLTELVTKIK